MAQATSSIANAVAIRRYQPPMFMRAPGQGQGVPNEGIRAISRNTNAGHWPPPVYEGGRFPRLDRPFKSKNLNLSS